MYVTVNPTEVTIKPTIETINGFPVFGVFDDEDKKLGMIILDYTFEHFIMRLKVFDRTHTVNVPFETGWEFDAIINLLLSTENMTTWRRNSQ